VAKQQLPDDAAKALTRLEDCTTHHRSFCDRVDARHRSYWGHMEKRSKAARWTHKHAPKYVNHIVETTLASLVDEELRFRVRARSKMYEPGEFERAAAGAKALEILLRWQLEQCHFDEQQRPYVLQNMIAGLTVGKISWQNTTRLRRKLVTQPQLVEDPVTGEPLGYVPRLVEVEQPDTVFDGPMFEVCDVRDFFWDEAAVSLDRCSVVAHRVWMTFDELKQAEKRGLYKNVDELKESKDFSGDDYSDREFDANDAKRTKNRVAVEEIYWRTPSGIRTCTLGNRTVLLKEPRDNPYWHGEYPFVVCSTQPDLFRIPGMSQVEKIMELQEALWDLINQTADNLEFINNAIAIVPEGFDYEGWRHEPQAVNEAPDPSSVQMWAPNVIPAQVSLGHQALLKGEMQNLAGAFPFSSGTESQTMDQKTATGASIVTSLAQRSIAAQKYQLYLSYQRMGQQFLELDQQYVREPVWVEVVGVDSQPEFEQILPEVLQGQFNFSMRPMTESMMRQEKRAEALAKFQVLMQAVPLFAMAQLPINPKTLLEDFLEAYDEPDVERFFSSQPQPAMAAAGGQPGQPSPNGGQPLGVTAPQSIDPAVSPSNQVSMSPELMNQRARAMSGGPNNQ
jgi:hypothetical protein